MLDRKTGAVTTKDALEHLERERAARRAIVDAVLSTEAGAKFFADFYEWAGQDKTSIARDKATGGIDLVTTAINEVNRAAYLHYANLATRELLLKAENLAHAKRDALHAAKSEEERKK